MAARIKSISNKTAADLLLLLCEKTVGFGRGFIELSYTQIAACLDVGTRAISNAAKILEEQGHIHRERAAHRIYRWRIVLQEKDVLNDPTGTYLTESGGVMIDRSAPCGSIDHDHDDQSIMTPPLSIEHADPQLSTIRVASSELSETPLKKLIKDKDLKKQQQNVRQDEEVDPPIKPLPQPAVIRRADDEPFHKILLKELQGHGISNRVARDLCRNHEHTLISQVLKTAPQRSGIKNLAAYIVSEIKDGGYNAAPTSTSQSSPSSSCSKPLEQASVTYRTPEQTQQEHEALEQERLQREQSYRDQGRILYTRFQTLTEEVKLRLKLLASLQLARELPQTGNREQMLKDKTFQRLANRTVLDRFFGWIDKGLDTLQALSKLENSLKTA